MTTKSKAGRELDREIAILVLGGKPSRFPDVPYVYNEHGKDIWNPDDGPHYSTDVAAAGAVVERVIELNHPPLVIGRDKWRDDWSCCIGWNLLNCRRR